jgi:hypothetical protein
MAIYADKVIKLAKEKVSAGLDNPDGQSGQFDLQKFISTLSDTDKILIISILVLICLFLLIFFILISVIIKINKKPKALNVQPVQTRPSYPVNMQNQQMQRPVVQQPQIQQSQRPVYQPAMPFQQAPMHMPQPIQQPRPMPPVQPQPIAPSATGQQGQQTYQNYGYRDPFTPA